MIRIKSLSFGRLGLISKIKQPARNVITNSCVGKLTANIFLGNAGVGKSTITGWITTFPGIFKVGKTSAGTTTLGTWISTAITRLQFTSRTAKMFDSHDHQQRFIDQKQVSELADNFIFMDTEGIVMGAQNMISLTIFKPRFLELF